MTSKETLDLFKSMDVMSETEVKARQEVELDTYILQTQIEGRVFNELVYSYIIPATVAYQNTLLTNVLGLKEVYGAAHKNFNNGPLNLIEQISEHLQALKKNTDAMVEARKKANAMTDIYKKAFSYCEDVKPYFEEIRKHSVIFNFLLISNI